jgi:hypothetical protein
MKQVSNKEIAAVFKEAKKYLATSKGDNKTTYICIAINEVSDTKYRLFNSCVCARSIINERLGESFTVGSWLAHNGFITNNDFNDRKYQNQLQKYRHRWLDSLIEEFSK